MKNYLTVFAFGALLLIASCAPYTGKTGSQIDPVLSQIAELAHKRESKSLTIYQKSQLPEFAVFHGQQITIEGEVRNVDTNGKLYMMGRNVQVPIIDHEQEFYPSILPLVNYSPNDTLSLTSLSKGQSIILKNKRITKIIHEIAGRNGYIDGVYLGWVLIIELAD